mmetsp:Transcript_51473/g.115783  ORF Transcript_51473/g.115783 Transcript_51473/m.115783 type:complete len:247 (-) Transcript_51473:49-789(-)
MRRNGRRRNGRMRGMQQVLSCLGTASKRHRRRMARSCASAPQSGTRSGLMTRRSGRPRICRRPRAFTPGAGRATGPPPRSGSGRRARGGTRCHSASRTAGCSPLTRSSRQGPQLPPQVLPCAFTRATRVPSPTASKSSSQFSPAMGDSSSRTATRSSCLSALLLGLPPARTRAPARCSSFPASQSCMVLAAWSRMGTRWRRRPRLRPSTRTTRCALGSRCSTPLTRGTPAGVRLRSPSIGSGPVWP